MLVDTKLAVLHNTNVDLWISIQLLDSLSFFTAVGYWTGYYDEQTNSFYISLMIRVKNLFSFKID